MTQLTPASTSAATDAVNGDWTVNDSAELYGLQEWGAGYFGVADNGELVVKAPTSAGEQKVSLCEIADGLRQRGLEMPVLLRIENLVDARIGRINEAFADAIKANQYQGVYRGAFPIKVNQQSHVVEEIARFGERYHHGLEAGSKAELLIAMATLTDRESLIICNGYKDAEFIDLGLQAQKLGFKCFFVVETPSELPLILERSKELDVEPMIGLRAKLSTKVDGHWSGDSGERSLFGLNSLQIVELVDRLKADNMLHCLQLLHFHLGSQIPNIRNIRTGTLEACRFYTDLVAEGAPMGYFDMGGGLAVDYDGTNDSGGHSRNYTVSEYCFDVVEAVKESMDANNLPHPTLISESGRATVAHMTVLLFNILDVSHFEPGELPLSLPEDSAEALLNLWQTLQLVSLINAQECYNDAIHYRGQIHDLFQSGDLTLRTRALADNVYLATMQKIAALIPSMRRVPAELETLPDQLADIYYGNFSVFQSLPDSWAIDQVFPVVPIHRLNEEPSRRAIIADLTCDCDGKLDKFSSPDGETSTLPVHPVKAGEEYYLGVFLVGAYQETLGDLHNLFGDTNVASVRVHPDGSTEFIHELQGDSISDVLSYVEYQPQQLLQKFRRSAEEAVRDGRISVAERQAMLGAYTDSLNGYTYFER